MLMHVRKVGKVGVKAEKGVRGHVVIPRGKCMLAITSV